MPLHITTSANFTSKEAVSIATAEIGITTSTPLLTIGASGCIIILFHVDGIGGAMAHIQTRADELPAMEKMMDALMKRNATAAQVEVLLGGGALREMGTNWHQNFLTKLSRVGIQLGNIIDARTTTPEHPIIPIGNKVVDRIKNVVYDPKASQILSLTELDRQAHPTKGKSSSVKVYAIADTNGTISATARDGECIIL